MAELCAVVGVGQTKHAACRADVSIAGLVREAVDRALADANITIADVDAIVKLASANARSTASRTKPAIETSARQAACFV